VPAFILNAPVEVAWTTAPTIIHPMASTKDAFCSAFHFARVLDAWAASIVTGRFLETPTMRVR
jgi:hypothetical protein